MTDFRTMFEKEHIGAWDLDNRDVTITIEAVKAGELTGEGGKKTKKPIIKIAGRDKTFACNITNGRVIAGMYGNDTKEWVGKRITIYPTTTTFGPKTVECIRVRNKVPSGKDAQREPGQDG